MAPELVDFRTKLTARSHAVLTAVSLAGGRDMAEIAREIIDQWASVRIHESTLVLRLAPGEGASAAINGTTAGIAP